MARDRTVEACEKLARVRARAGRTVLLAAACCCASAPAILDAQPSRVVLPALGPGASVSVAAALDTADAGLLRARAEVRSGTADSLRFSVGLWCGLTVRAYLDPRRAGTPTWTSHQVRFGCPASRNDVILAPGRAFVIEEPFRIRRPSEEPTLRPGRYYLTVTVTFLRPTLTTPELAAGDVRVPR